jgi:hypothetical protein
MKGMESTGVSQEAAIFLLRRRCCLDDADVVEGLAYHLASVGRAELDGVLDGAVVGVGGGDDPRGEPYDEAALVGDHRREPRAHADAGPGRQPPRGAMNDCGGSCCPAAAAAWRLGADAGHAIFLGLPHEEGCGGGIASPLSICCCFDSVGLVSPRRTEGI